MFEEFTKEGIDMADKPKPNHILFRKLTEPLTQFLENGWPFALCIVAGWVLLILMNIYVPKFLLMDWIVIFNFVGFYLFYRCKVQDLPLWVTHPHLQNLLRPTGFEILYTYVALAPAGLITFLMIAAAKLWESAKVVQWMVSNWRKWWLGADEETPLTPPKRRRRQADPFPGDAMHRKD